MRSRRTILVLVAATVAVVGLAAGAVALVLGEAGGPRPRLCAIAAVACGLGAAGSIGLGYGFWLFHATVASTVEGLRRGRVVSAKTPGRFVAGSLTWAIQDLVDRSRQAAKGLQGQLDDMRLRTQLLERQKRHTEAILYSLQDAVIVIDEFDRVLLVNRAAGLLFACDAKLAPHRPVAELLGPAYQGFVEFLQQTRKATVEANRREIQILHEGRPATYECTASWARDGASTEGGVVAVLHDVTQEKEVAQIKNDFVSYVSHELKTPLASIRASAEMLMDGEADDEQTRREFYGVIQSQAGRLNRLIEDILNLSRLESGLMPVTKTALSLAILVEEQVRMIKSTAEERHIQIQGQKPIVYDQVVADRDMMSMVIVNLLSNAVKYNTPGGSVAIETEVDEIRSVVRVSVTDTGVGIPADELEHLFEKFYRAPANANRAEGTGLGLNLVKHIVETLHGGRVFMQSQVGAGSTFGFELPLANRPSVGAAAGRLRG